MNKKWSLLIQNGNEYLENHRWLEGVIFRSFFSHQKKRIAEVLNLHDCPFKNDKWHPSGAFVGFRDRFLFGSIFEKSATLS